MNKPLLMLFIGLSLAFIALIWVEGYTGGGDGDGRGNRQPTATFVYDPAASSLTLEATRVHRTPEHATAAALTASPTVSPTPWPTPETEE